MDRVPRIAGLQSPARIDVIIPIMLALSWVPAAANAWTAGLAAGIAHVSLTIVTCFAASVLLCTVAEITPLIDCFKRRGSVSKSKGATLFFLFLINAMVAAM